ncbi:MAG: pyrroline-5-carboxylate reductase [Defluviitaleaceae bacterium]|nr:pyrroline-5-carboxylate reductase [Defluviitaleaceae bacterium]MCL2263798.1 pyrroline-5-carboxylate reductase [Defluviitaleaceae bacterium]
MKKLGFIGAGNMAEAIIRGVINSGAAENSDIIVSDANEMQLDYMRERFMVQITRSNMDVAKAADILFLSVKPNVYDVVINEICSGVKDGALVVIIAAGLSIEAVRAKFCASSDSCAGECVKLIKVMPNTPAMVNCGMSAICAAENVTPAELETVLQIFNSVGKTEILPEKLFDVFTALAGSSPAYVFTFVEAMADAGVKHGLSRKQSLEISTQAVIGAAKLLQNSDDHPATLRDAVCSPGGTTIAAVCELERTGFRNAVISAVDVCTEKYRSLG